MPLAGASLIITCEHGGHEVPPDHAARFAGAADLLRTHRGWDAGALDLARDLADAFGAPLVASTTTRLLVDLNRSIGHPRLFSEFGAGWSRSEREAVLAAHYRPHREAAEAEVARAIAAGRSVVHIGSHSFTPVLDGVERRVDVGVLYDPRRAREVALARRWLAALANRAPLLRLRRNHPYRGNGDGLTSALRRRFAPNAYLGLELEVNQRFVTGGGERWARLRADIAASLRQALAGVM